MSTSYSTSLQIALMGDGDQSSTWGDTTNTNWNLMEQAVTGVTGISLTGLTTRTLLTLNGTSDESRNIVLVGCCCTWCRSLVILSRGYNRWGIYVSVADI